MTFFRHLATVSTVLFSILAVGPAHAQQLGSNLGSWFDGFDDWIAELGNIKAEDFQFSIGTGVGIAPDYPGSDEYKALALPLFQIRYKDTLTVDPLGIRLRVWRNDCCRLRVVVGLSESRNADPGSPVDPLPNVGRGMNVGFTFEGRVAGPLAFRLNARREVAGGHGGFTLAPSLGVVLRNKAGTYSVIPELALTWANGTFMDKFFSIGPAGALASGLPVFDASSGLREAALRVTATYRIDEDWTLIARGQAARLMNDAARSPVTRPSGSRFQGLIGGGFLYTF